MANRGRGTQEIRDTRNAFFLTTNDVVTLLANADRSVKERQFEAPTVYRKAPPADEYGMDWKFMYQKESDRIGANIPMSDSKLSAAVGYRVPPAEAARKKAMGQHPIVYQPGQEGEIGICETGTKPREQSRAVSKETAEAVIKAYVHVPKAEHPLKTTSNAAYGSKAPTEATYAFHRRARLQAFSNGFNSARYRDMGLNTAITKSAVHSSLDPQFA